MGLGGSMANGHGSGPSFSNDGIGVSLGEELLMLQGNIRDTNTGPAPQLRKRLVGPGPWDPGQGTSWREVGTACLTTFCHKHRQDKGT